MEKYEKYYIWVLILGCIFFIFSNIGLYPLIDIDETRYVNMSKYMYLTHNFLTPTLNFEPFLEKPPLYFWLNVLSFKIFNTENIFACRFMTGFIGSFSILMTYFFVNKISKNKLFGFLSANVLLSCVWFLTFSHIAILDLIFMVLSMSAIYCAILPLFDIKEKNKKYFWYLGYIFMALSILAKGFIGLAIPCGVVFFTYLIFKKTKELFKPVYIIPGILIFLLISLPWHIMIYQAQGMEWVNMYILKHHFARLLNSEGLGRKQPFLFYVPIILIGFIPWTFNFIAILIKDIKKLILKIKSVKTFKDLFKIENIDNKIIIFSYVYFIYTFLFFSSASTKLPPYILTAFPPLAIITGYFWYRAIKTGENKKTLLLTCLINSITFLCISFLGLIFAFIYKILLADNIEFYVDGAVKFALPALSIIFIISLISIIFIKKQQVLKIFVLNLALMLCVIVIACKYVMPYYTSFSQDELEEYQNYIIKQKKSQTITYGFGKKYSILNPAKKIMYIVNDNQEEYEKIKKFAKTNKNENIYIITRKNVKIFDNKNYKKIKGGKAYKLYKICF